MGGALTLHLARKNPGLMGIILINHALFLMPDPRLWLLPLARFFITAVPGSPSDIKDPTVVETSYDCNPIPAAYQLTRLLKKVRADVPRVTVPALIFKSRQDHVIPVSSATYTLDRLASRNKRLVWLDNSYHVATVDYDKDVICNRSIGFIREIIKEGA